MCVLIFGLNGAAGSAGCLLQDFFGEVGRRSQLIYWRLSGLTHGEGGLLFIDKSMAELGPNAIA